MSRAAFVYEIKPRGVVSGDGTDTSFSPALIVAVLPFKNKFTHNKGLSLNDALAVSPISFIEDYCSSVSVSDSKQGHVSSFSGMFLDPANEFHRKFAPGDWLFAWMFDNRDDARRVKAKIEKGEAANDFGDGLKFVGRITSVRRVVQVAQNGMMMRRVSVTGQAFSELDTAVYFDPDMQIENSAGSLFHRNLAGSVNGLLNRGELTVQSVIPQLFDIFVGRGPGRASAVSGKDIKTPNRAFLVPIEVGRLLGRTVADPDKAKLSYAELVECIYGVQKYGANAKDEQGFVPNNLSKTSGNHHSTSLSMEGTFGTRIVPWVNVPIWSIFNQFLNAPVNEMYTALRVAPNGKVLPHFIVRQTPFSTDEFEKTHKKATSFKSLPRWKLPTLMVRQYDTGTSNSMRINYVHIRAQPAVAAREEKAIFRATVKPQYDPLDINRNGLFGYIATISSTVSSQTAVAGKNQNNFYTSVVADYMIGNHLRFTGTLNSMGVQAPIAVGDNFEFDGAVYHIEGINHTISVSPNGSTQFGTTLNLTHGVPVDDHSFLETAESPAPENSVTYRPEMTAENGNV